MGTSLAATVVRRKGCEHRNEPGLTDGVGGAQAPADLADGLVEALRVLDEGEAEKSLARLAEAATRTDDHIGLLQQFHGEVDRAELRPPGLGHRRPDEHPRTGGLDVPADP